MMGCWREFGAELQTVVRCGPRDVTQKCIKLPAVLNSVLQGEEEVDSNAWTSNRRDQAADLTRVCRELGRPPSSRMFPEDCSAAQGGWCVQV